MYRCLILVRKVAAWSDGTCLHVRPQWLKEELGFHPRCSIALIRGNLLPVNARRSFFPPSWYFTSVNGPGHLGRAWSVSIGPKGIDRLCYRYITQETLKYLKEPPQDNNSGKRDTGTGKGNDTALPMSRSWKNRPMARSLFPSAVSDIQRRVISDSEPDDSVSIPYEVFYRRCRTARKRKKKKHQTCDEGITAPWLMYASAFHGSSAVHQRPRVVNVNIFLCWGKHVVLGSVQDW